jgi:C_GCAxxG_C_C family probable redox protein
MSELKLMPGEKPEEMAVRLFTDGKLSCSESVLAAMAAWWGVESPLIPRIATPFRGGLCGTQSICGAVTGGLMAIGLKLGRDEGSQNAQVCVDMGKEFMKHAQCDGALDCRSIIGLDLSIKEQSDLFHSKVRGEVCTGLIVRCCMWLAENVK